MIQTTIKEKINIVPFENLAMGSFFYCDNHLFLKINTITTECGDDYNAIEVKSGFGDFFTKGTSVIAVKQIKIN